MMMIGALLMFALGAFLLDIRALMYYEHKRGEDVFCWTFWSFDEMTSTIEDFFYGTLELWCMMSTNKEIFYWAFWSALMYDGAQINK